MKKNIHDIITRILSGESTPEDDLALIDWLNKNQDNIDEFHGRERVWNAINVIFAREKYNDKAAYERFIHHIGSPQRMYSNHLGIKKLLIKTLRWAAIGIIFMVIGSLIFYIVSDSISQLETSHYEVIVPVGSRSNLVLTDGTSVWLNAGSKLSYSKKFGENDRSVYLEGEGYFKVEKDSKDPFTVITSELEIVAKGTSFNVKSYHDEDVIQATLVSGSILVNRTKNKTTEQGLTLEPNQQLTYFRDTRQMKLSLDVNEDDEPEGVNKNEIKLTIEDELPRAILSRGIDTEIFTSWKDNRLILDDEPFGSIAIKLERRFGTNIIIKDEDIKRRRFKGRFEEITMEQALNALQFVSPFEYFMVNDTIYISSK
jgi:transmembrane sensor